MTNNKKYMFMSGLYRSGNTVLSAILNQNPDIYVSPLSPLVEYLWRCHDPNIEEAITHPNKSSINKMISSMIDNLYEDIEKPIVFDRSKAWANPDNIGLIKTYINFNPKIVFTIRPLKERIASIININKKSLLYEMQNNNYLYEKNKTENDNIASYILNSHRFQMEYFPYKSIKNTKNNIHVIKYEDLVFNTEQVMKDLYSYLELEYFDHDFNNIKKTEQELDADAKLPINLHEIKSSIVKSDLVVFDIISQEIIDKCDEMDLFYN